MAKRGQAIEPGDGRGPPGDTIVLSIRLESGQFEMALKHPIFGDTTEADFRDSVDAWLDLSMQALRIGLSSMTATLKERERS